MTDEITSDDKEQDQNRRVLLQIFFERLNHLAGLISNTDGFAIVILIGIVVGIFASNDLLGLIILTILGIISLIGWRIYVHRLNRQSVKFYGLIIECERKLGIDDEFSLLRRFVVDLYPQIKNDTSENQFNFIHDLISREKFHDRGHRFADLLAFNFVFILLGVLIIRLVSLDKINFSIYDWVISSLFFVLLLSVFYGYQEFKYGN